MLVSPAERQTFRKAVTAAVKFQTMEAIERGKARSDKQYLARKRGPWCTVQP